MDFSSTRSLAAIQSGNMEKTKKMSEQESVDSRGNNPLYHACKRGNVSLVRTLICEYKADVTARDSLNSTPLQVAALNGKKEVVLALIKEFDVTSVSKALQVDLCYTMHAKEVM